jgi:hypothetical protein
MTPNNVATNASERYNLSLILNDARQNIVIKPPTAIYSYIIT